MLTTLLKTTLKILGTILLIVVFGLAAILASLFSNTKGYDLLSDLLINILSIWNLKLKDD